jgi:hypothetical protein
MNAEKVYVAARMVADSALVWRYEERRLNQTKPETIARYILSKRRRRAKADLLHAIDAYVEATKEATS